MGNDGFQLGDQTLDGWPEHERGCEMFSLIAAVGLIRVY